MVNSIYNLFNRAIKWNAFEGIVYQSLLTVHQAILFTVAGSLIYGTLGILYSLLYLLIIILNLGFDKSLPAFYERFTIDKKKFKIFFIKQLFIQILITCLFSLIIIFFNKAIAYLFSYNFKCSIIELNTWVLLGILLICESLKKSLRIIGELSFLNKFIAIIEIVLMLLFLILFWSIYFYYGFIILELIFFAHLIQSIIGCLVFILLIKYKVYNVLDNNLKDGYPSIRSTNYSGCLRLKVGLKEIIFSRSTNFINQISHILFSGNFLIPFLANITGPAQIGILKLINIIAVYFSVVFERTFGLTSSALLSNLKNATVLVKQNAFNIATKKLFITLLAITIFLLINFKTALNYYFDVNNIGWLVIYLFLFVILIENFFITLEQFFIVEGKIYYFIITNILLSIIFFIINYSAGLNLIFILSLIILLRIISFIILKHILTYKLKIKLILRINIFYILGFIFGSLLFLLFFKTIINLI